MKIKGKDDSSQVFTGVQPVKMLPLELVESANPHVKISVKTGQRFEQTKTGFMFFPSRDKYETWKCRQFLTQFCFGLSRDWIDTESITRDQIKVTEFSFDELLDFIRESIETINEVLTNPSVANKKYFAVFIAESYNKEGKSYNTSRLFVPSYKDSKKNGGCFEFPLYFPIIHWKPQDTLRDSEDNIILCEAFSAKYQHVGIPEIPQDGDFVPANDAPSLSSDKSGEDYDPFDN